MILYIGNYLSTHGNTPSSVEILGKLLMQRYRMRLVSQKRNKVRRLVDIVWTLIAARKTTSVVLVDTYSSQGFYFALTTAVVCRLIGKPYIPILRGGNLQSRLEHSSRLSRFIFNRAHILVAPSDFMVHTFTDFGYQNIKKIPNSIPIHEYSFKTRVKYKPCLFWVRSFHRVYNPLMAILVLEKLRVHFPEARLCMVGPDKDGSLLKCKTYVTEKALDAYIQFTGVLTKPEWHKVSQSYDIFINTSNVDNTPVSVIEAMALGLPVVSTRVGGVPYLIESDKTGLLVEANDVDAMVDSVNKLLNEPGLALAISIHGREVAESFDWNKIKKDWFALLDPFEEVYR